MKDITADPIVILSFSEKVDCIILTQLLSAIKGIMTRDGLEWNNRRMIMTSKKVSYHRRQNELRYFAQNWAFLHFINF